MNQKSLTKRLRAGIKTWATRNEGDDLIECSKLESGKVEFGKLVEKGEKEMAVGDIVELCHNNEKMKVKICEL